MLEFENLVLNTMNSKTSLNTMLRSLLMTKMNSN